MRASSGNSHCCNCQTTLPLDWKLSHNALVQVRKTVSFLSEKGGNACNTARRSGQRFLVWMRGLSNMTNAFCFEISKKQEAVQVKRCPSLINNIENRI